MLNIVKNLIVKLIKLFSVSIFFVLLPILLAVSWLRFLIKKIFKSKPKILFSFVGIPMAFLNTKAVRTQGYEADVYSISVAGYFRPLSHGLIIADKKFLRLFLYLTDYLPLLVWAIFKYDIFESTFRGGILSYSYLQKIEPQLLKLLAKKVIFYGYGADCTVLEDTRKLGRFNVAMDRNDQDDNLTRRNVARAKKYGDVLIGAGDLIYFGKKQVLTPLAVDLNQWKYIPPKDRKQVVILHPTNHRLYKGTRFITQAIERLKKEELPIKFVLIEKKNFKQAQKIYREGDIFVTDVIGGWHGFTAIEAMAIGRPVVSYIRQVFYNAHKFYAKDIPVVNAVPTTLTKVLKKLVLDYELRKRTGLEGREYALKYHSLEFVGVLRSIVYEYIWQGKKINQTIFEKEAKKRGLIE